MEELEEYTKFSWKNAWSRQDMTISRKLFLKHTLILGLLTTLSNALCMFFFYRWRVDPVSFRFISLMIVFIAVNFISGVLVGNYYYFRFKWSYKLVFNSCLYLFPLLGLYLYIVLISQEREKELPVFKHVLIGFLLSFAVSYGIGVYRSNRPVARIAPNFNPSTQYILRVVDEASVIFRLKETCSYEKLGQESLDCFMSGLKQKFSQYSFTNTGKILSAAVIATAIFQMKERAVNYPEKIKGINSINSTIMLIDRLIELNEYDVQNTFTISAPYGIYLISGAQEIPLLLAIETSIDYEFSVIAGERLLSLHKKLKLKIDKEKSGFSQEEFERYQTKINELEKIIKKTYPKAKLPLVSIKASESSP